jgi:GNAT superfamily N-acetyltransferase
MAREESRVGFADIALRAYRDIQRARVGESREAVELRTGGAFFTENAIVLPTTDLAEPASETELQRLTESLRDYSASVICDRGSQTIPRLRRLGWRSAPDLSLMGQNIDTIPMSGLGSNRVEVERIRTRDVLEEWLDAAIVSGWPQYSAHGVIALVKKNFQTSLSAAPQTVGITHYWLARIEGHVAGVAAAIFHPPTVIFDLVGVIGDHRHQGVARSLIEARVEAALEAGCSQVVLLPTHDGYGLYKRLGFEIAHPGMHEVLLNSHGQATFQLFFRDS